MAPFPDSVIHIGKDILSAIAVATVHPKIVTVSFTCWITQVWIPLKNNPPGASCSSDPTIIDRALSSLLISAGSQPGFESERGAGVRIVFGKVRHGSCGIAAAI